MILSLKMFYHVASFNLEQEKLGKWLYCLRDNKVSLCLKLIGQISVMFSKPEHNLSWSRLAMERKLLW